MDPLRFVRPDFGDLDQYVPVQPLDVLAREIGLPVEDLVKLDANENLYGPVPAVLEALRRADLNIYPDPDQVALRQAVADYLGVTPAQIVGGSGADDLIDILIRLVKPAATVSAPPTFGMYSFLSKIENARALEVPRTPTFEIDIEGIAEAVASGARLVFVASPNNPTGNSLSDGEVEALCALDALIVVDEAYAEFSGRSCIPLIEDHPNLVVLRTFSKWAGLAGLRVGYSVSHPELARHMMAIKQPYNVNVAGDVAARAALANRDEVFKTVRAIIDERERLAAELRRREWLHVLPSEANFVLVRVDVHDAAAVASELRRRGILVRHYSRPDLAGYIRISAGRPQDTDRLLAALDALEEA